MGRIICVTNQKGGVGKTTTAISLGRGLMLQKKAKVLFVDMDAQCNMSYVLGVEDDRINIMTVLMRRNTLEEAIQHVGEFDVIPSHQDISAIEKYIGGDRKEYLLNDVLSPVRNRYDYIIIDSPPALGLTTINILTASDAVVIPAAADILSLQGIGQLYNTISAVKTYCNPGLKIDGILITRHNARLVHSRELREMIEETASDIGTKVYRASIREAVALREAMTSRSTIFDYAPRSKQAADYKEFVAEFLENGN